MNLAQLMSRVTETIGAEIVSAESLLAAIANCYADLRSRGYRQFVESELTPLTIEAYQYAHAPAPTDLRKTVYCKVTFDNAIKAAKRVSLASRLVRTKLVNGYTRSYIEYLNYDCIYYIIDGIVYIEWYDTGATPILIKYGYYQNLQAPEITIPAGQTEVSLDAVELTIRPEFDDALVFYACYFYYSRYMKDLEKIQLYENRYKYYIEDILYELGAEDRFNEEDVVIVDGD